MLRSSVLCCLVGLGICVATSEAGDWARFRGPNGTGISLDSQPTPVEWSETKNLKWKAELPGPGSSCPIVVGDRVFVTCWTGYATDRNDPGDQSNLKRVLVSIDRQTGQTQWTAEVPAALPEDEYRGMFAEHGYASHTPVSDGQRVYVFFGKSGVFAFDMQGQKLWEANVGTDRDARGWGSASSPILYNNLLIVPAVVESHSMFALDKMTGKVVWKQEAEGFGGTWGTPILVELEGGRTDLVLGVPYEIWGFNPENGKLRWYCEAINSNSMCSSVIAADGVVYAAESGPGGGGTVAVRAGGSGDVTESHVLWTGRDRSRIGTPVVHDGRLYWVSNKVATCIDAKTGDRVFQERLGGGSTAAAGDRDDPPGRGFGGGFGGRRRGGMGGQDYSSPVVADGKLYYATRGGEIHVVRLGGDFEVLATNRFNDGGDYSATPAIADGQIFIRSSKNLFCVAAE